MRSIADDAAAGDTVVVVAVAAVDIPAAAAAEVRKIAFDGELRASAAAVADVLLTAAACDETAAEAGPFTWMMILSTSSGDVHDRVTQPATTPATTDCAPVAVVVETETADVISLLLDAGDVVDVVDVVVVAGVWIDGGVTYIQQQVQAESRSGWLVWCENRACA